MSKISHLLLEKEILLESGTNELEILVFEVGEYIFGVNVAKVREVLPAPRITHLPDAHPAIRGVFKLRSQVVPCVSLADFLGIQTRSDAAESTAILTDFNQQQTAFLVDTIQKIHRLSWENILAVPAWKALHQTPVTALARCSGRLILMLDFEMILDEVTNRYFRTSAVANPERFPRDQALVLLVEDSPTVREAIQQTLEESGYTQLIVFENGKEAWEWLERKITELRPEGTSGTATVPCDLIIADIEMPQVDGLHLTKRVKNHAQLRNIPVLLYSSIVTPENRRKGEAVGADAQVTKPDLCHVVEYADQLIFVKSKLTPPGLSGSLSSKPYHAEDRASNPATGQERNPEIREANSDTSILAEKAEGGGRISSFEENPAAAFTVPKELSENSHNRGTLEAPSVDSDYGFANSLFPPEPVDVHLWQTFIQELQNRVRTVRELLAAVQKASDLHSAPSFDHLVELARSLHTIKSAAMVLPLDIVVRVTHALESVLSHSADANFQWNQQLFMKYCNWLELFLDCAGLSWYDVHAIGERFLGDVAKFLEEKNAASVPAR